MTNVRKPTVSPPAASAKAEEETKLPIGDSTGEMEDSGGGLKTGGSATKTPDKTTGPPRVFVPEVK
jgi:hypothetical protein